MKIKITQSFAEVNMVAFHVGEVLDVPVAIGQEWLRLGRAVSLEEPMQHPDPKTATPKVQQAERAVKPKPETRAPKPSARGGASN
jgi:hypothetical protein